uniref:Uncharacterized protein n=1 Tax=Plectus sambesii TaxID=2011161 RepID=A0A914VKS2_9BILA
MERSSPFVIGLLAVILVSVASCYEDEYIRSEEVMPWIHRALPMRMKQHRYVYPFVRQSELATTAAPLAVTDKLVEDNTDWSMMALS